MSSGQHIYYLVAILALVANGFISLAVLLHRMSINARMAKLELDIARWINGKLKETKEHFVSDKVCEVLHKETIWKFEQLQQDIATLRTQLHEKKT